MLTIIYHLVKFESNTSEFLYKYHVMLIDWLILFLSLTWYMLWKKVLKTMLMILKMIKV